MSDTPIADMVDQMLSAGLPPEMIVLAVRTTERAIIENTRGRVLVDPVADKRREWDRERKARARAGLSTGQVEMSLSSSKTINTDISKEERKSVAVCPVDSPVDKSRSKKQIGILLPSDWKPNEGHYELMRSLGVDLPWMEGQAQSMRDWAGANSHRPVAKKSNWDQAFSGWMRREATKRSPQDRNRGPSMADIAAGKFL